METNYIVTKRFKGKAICGDINLPYGTECVAIGGIINFQGSPICSVTSQTAFEHFCRNDDGEGLKRGELTQNILKAVEKADEDTWARLWQDEECRKLKRKEHNDHWIWGYEFYNATIEDLEYLREVIGTRKNDNKSA